MDKIIMAIQAFRIPSTNEKAMQDMIEKALIKAEIPHKREFRFDNNNIVDFFALGVAIECKVQGSPSSIFSQLERYAAFDETKEILLLTSKHMGIPSEINGKPARILKTNLTWF